ncbi:(2Fe-2S)-binding protein [Cardiobacteriaceae bacterium TAE3-ERU3]|nr:(2Fe-2S)-binding protein [Cardiobacteriaceae bacterium TAE3-ERU3]
MFFDLVDHYFSAERDEIIAQLRKLAYRDDSASVVALNDVMTVPRYSSEWLMAEMRTLGTNRRMIAASLMHKKLMKATLTTWLAAYLLGEQPASNGLALEVAAPHRLHWSKDTNQNVDPYDFLSELATQFVRHMYDIHRLSPDIAFGNAAMTLAVPWSKLAGFRHDGEAVMASAEQFFARLCPELGAMLEWHVLHQNGQNAAYARRRSCCLKYRVEGKTYCTTCNKVVIEEQHAALLAKW